MKANTLKSSILFTAFFVYSIVFSQSGWVQQLSNTTQSLNSIFCLNSNTAWVCGAAGTILKTTNGGTSWIQQNSAYTNNLSDIFFIDSQTGWACGGYLNFPNISQFHVLKTTNSGTNWAVTSTFGSISSPFIDAFNSISFIDASTGIITVSTTYGLFGSGYMLKSTNGGMNWVQTSPMHTNRETVFLSASTGLLISQYWDDMTRDTGYFYRTTDQGSSWSLVNKYSGFHYYHLSFINPSTGWIVGLQRNVATYNGAVFKTINGGLNWNFAVVINNSFALKSISFSSPDTGYVCGPGIYKSINGGTNWSQQVIPTTSARNKIKMINSITGWCIGANGVILRTTNGGIDAVRKISEIVPQSYSLSQNYPNPFNPNTMIRFDIPPNVSGRTSNVTLTVVNSLGQVNAVLVNEYLVSGSYEVSWDASNYSSGVYYYRITVDDSYSATKKMVLIK